jgi:uncharacterized protein YaiL (DUF2058 family)
MIMSIKETAEKLEKYQERLREGKVEKIRPIHVERVLAKLFAKQEHLTAELSETEKQSTRDRLEHKLETVDALIEKARWLAKQI